MVFHHFFKTATPKYFFFLKIKILYKFYRISDHILKGRLENKISLQKGTPYGTRFELKR